MIGIRTHSLVPLLPLSQEKREVGKWLIILSAHERAKRVNYLGEGTDSSMLYLLILTVMNELNNWRRIFMVHNVHKRKFRLQLDVETAHDQEEASVRTYIIRILMMIYATLFIKGTATAIETTRDGG